MKLKSTYVHTYVPMSLSKMVASTVEGLPGTARPEVSSILTTNISFGLFSSSKSSMVFTVKHWDEVVSGLLVTGEPLVNDSTCDGILIKSTLAEIKARHFT